MRRTLIIVVAFAIILVGFSSAQWFWGRGRTVMYTANELEVDAQTFLKHLPERLQTQSQLVSLSDVDPSRYQRDLVFFYNEPKDVRVCRLGKDGPVTMSPKSEDGAAYIAASNLRILTRLREQASSPIGLIIVNSDDILSKQYFAMPDQSKLGKFKAIWGENIREAGQAAWIKAGKIFAQDNLGDLTDSAVVENLLKTRIAQLDAKVCPVETPSTETTQVIEQAIASARRKMTSLNLPATGWRNEGDVNRKIENVIADVTYGNPILLSQQTKESAYQAVRNELWFSGPLTSIMAGEQGAEHPVQMRGDGTFWYGEKQLPVAFFNDAHRAEIFKRLGKPEKIGKDGCAEFPIEVSVDDETTGNEDDYKTVKQWLRIPKHFLSGLSEH